MIMRARTKKIVAAISVLMVVALAVYASVLFVIIKNINDEPDKLPQITAYAHGRTIETQPAGFCTIDLSQCAQIGEIYELDVPQGSALQLSLSKDVSTAEWAMLAVYQDADGNQSGEPRFFKADEAMAVTVEALPEKQLVGVEIHLAVGEGSEQGLLIWSIKTS
ncbi:uncharacterized protein DUF2771 [Rhodococcus sp. OK302]|nr:uncharacterized protein DUF2771 [Rhodococcus sp. OK302]